MALCTTLYVVLDFWFFVFRVISASSPCTEHTVICCREEMEYVEKKWKQIFFFIGKSTGLHRPMISLLEPEKPCDCLYLYSEVISLGVFVFFSPLPHFLRLFSFLTSEQPLPHIHPSTVKKWPLLPTWNHHRGYVPFLLLHSRPISPHVSYRTFM